MFIWGILERNFFFESLSPPFALCPFHDFSMSRFQHSLTADLRFTILFCDGCTFFRDDGDDNDTEDVDLCTEKNTSRDDDDARVFLFFLFFIVVVDVATAVASVLSSYQQERVFKARATF